MIHCGYVINEKGEIYLQLPDGNAQGFVIADGDQEWEIPPFRSWTAIADDDPRITDQDRERLSWLLPHRP